MPRECMSTKSYCSKQEFSSPSSPRPFPHRSTSGNIEVPHDSTKVPLATHRTSAQSKERNARSSGRTALFPAILSPLIFRGTVSAEPALGDPTDLEPILNHFFLIS